ncbi:rho GTPase-activating protein 44-like isoform X2 [Oryctolagus cuniculus]|uniref:rho GTPase-activating protein 44-like isoform X2 n=1 Tax=Oryctolagus cuniculus TaxID=9986 RepID=UPI003879E418
MKKQFNRMKQLANQTVGRAEKTEVLSEDLLQVHEAQLYWKQNSLEPGASRRDADIVRSSLSTALQRCPWICGKYHP